MSGTRARQQGLSLRHLPLRLQIGLLTGALCVLLVAAVSSGAAWFGRAEAARETGARMTLLAAELAHRLDTGMAQRYREVQTLAQLAPMQSLWTGDPASLRTALEQLKSSFPHYAWIGFADPAGVVRAATGGLLEGQSVSQRPWFVNGQHRATVSDVHEAVLLGKLLGRDTGGEPPRFVDVAFPVRDAHGVLIGVLAAHLYSEWAEYVRSGFAALLQATQADSARDIELRVVAATGTTILGPQFGSADLDEASARMAAACGTALRTIDDRGTTYLEGMAVTKGADDFPGFGWIVVAREPASSAFAPVRAVVRAILATGAVIAAFGILLSCALGARIARPIRHLCDEADRIGRSPHESKLERVDGSLEVSRLSHALRSLVRRLGTAERELMDVTERATTASARVSEQIDGLRRLADTDPMTGVLNRRGLLNAVQAVRVAPAALRRFGVLIVDIDHFKRVNDGFGHAAGDCVIRRVADAIQETVRQHDIVARFGGEEFVVVVPNPAIEELASLAERVREAVQSVPPIAGLAPAVTVSIGGAVEAAGARDVQDTIDRADAALYAAKEEGRNCVRMARSDASGPEHPADRDRTPIELMHTAM